MSFDISSECAYTIEDPIATPQNNPTILRMVFQKSLKA